MRKKTLQAAAVDVVVVGCTSSKEIRWDEPGLRSVDNMGCLVDGSTVSLSQIIATILTFHTCASDG